MTKKATIKSISNKTTIRVALLSFVLLAIIAYGAFTIVMINSTPRTRDETLSYSIVSLSYRTDRLQFCIDHSISPCDDGSIQKWNDTHHDATFTLKSFQDLVKDSIEYQKSL